MNFFKPEIHNRVADKGTSGYCAEELPLIFYITACLYKILGFHEWIYRALSILIFFSGLFALYKICYSQFNDFIIAAFIGILLFLSTVFVFYANNFTTNTSSFAIVLMGWYFFCIFQLKSHNKYLYLAIGFFTLASLIKLSEAMSLITIAGVYLLENLNIIKFNINKRIFPQRISHLYPFIISSAVIVAWYSYVVYFNKMHNQTYYSFVLNAIWNMDQDSIKMTWIEVKDRWFPEYFHFSIFILILVSFIGNIIMVKKSNRLLFFITVTLFVGSILYLLLWFNNLKHHDYYTISIYIFYIFSLITFIDILNRNYRKILTSLVLRISIILLVIINLILTRNNYTRRYRGWQNDIEMYKDIQTITPFLRSIGISRFDKVISLPDVTVNYTLYMMNQPGWTGYNIDDKEQRLKNLISSDAKFLILTGKEILQKPYLKSYLYHPVGIYGNVSIFKLDNVKDSKNVVESDTFKLIDEIRCDAESFSKENQYFICSNNMHINCWKPPTTEKSHSGKYSAKVSKKDPFTMDILFPSVKTGDKYRISVWRYPKDANSVIVTCIKSVNTFYKSKFTSEKCDKDGWELISSEIEVPEELNNENLGFDLLYVGKDEGFCYFDDLIIQHYTKYSSNDLKKSN